MRLLIILLLSVLVHHPACDICHRTLLLNGATVRDLSWLSGTQSHTELLQRLQQNGEAISKLLSQKADIERELQMQVYDDNFVTSASD